MRSEAPYFTANILTLFPEMFPGFLGMSLAGRALDEGLWRMNVTNIRDFAQDRHRTVDDTPFGGGAGMVMRPDVLGCRSRNCHGKGNRRKHGETVDLVADSVSGGSSKSHGVDDCENEQEGRGQEYYRCLIRAHRLAIGAALWEEVRDCIYRIAEVPDFVRTPGSGNTGPRQASTKAMDTKQASNLQG